MESLKWVCYMEILECYPLKESELGFAGDKESWDFFEEWWDVNIVIV